MCFICVMFHLQNKYDHSQNLKNLERFYSFLPRSFWNICRLQIRIVKLLERLTEDLFYFLQRCMNKQWRVSEINIFLMELFFCILICFQNFDSLCWFRFSRRCNSSHLSPWLFPKPMHLESYFERNTSKLKFKRFWILCVRKRGEWLQ